MKSLKFLIIFVVFVIILTSCTIIILRTSDSNGSSGYNNLADIDKKMVCFLPVETKIKEVCKDTNLVYAMNTKQLQDYMADFDSCIVYLWNTNCEGKYCFSPDVFVQYCQTYNYQPVVVLFSYAKFDMVKDAMATFHPIFSISEQYYKTNNLSKYLSHFRADLSVPSIENVNYRAFWVFKKGKFDRFADVKPIKKYQNLLKKE